MIKRIFEPAVRPDADHGEDHDAVTEDQPSGTLYTLEVSFIVDDDADEHLQTPAGIRDEAQSWLESLGAAVTTVDVLEHRGAAPDPSQERREDVDPEPDEPQAAPRPPARNFGNG